MAAQVDLRGKLADTGKIHFLRAEWWTNRPKIVLIRYVVGRGRERSARLDLDKVAIMDDPEDAETIALVRQHTKAIWDVVAQEVAHL